MSNYQLAVSSGRAVECEQAPTKLVKAGSKMRKAWLFSLLTVHCSLLLVLSCENPVTSGVSTLPAGKGAFSLTLSDAGRTILPATPSLNDFAVYNLNFTPTNGGEAMNVDRTNETLPTDPILLEPGTYNLIVNAYKDNTKTQLAARGTLNNVTITAGGHTSATVTLKALLSDGTGTFRWEITVPDGVTADMTITPVNESGTQQENVILNPPADSGSRTLNSGPYSLIFNLENTDGKSVVWKELLYVYQNLESVFSFEFTDAHLIESIYTVTFDSNGGEPGEWGQSVLHGGTITTPAAPIKSQYAFIGWYTDNDTFANVWDFNNPVIESFTLYAQWLSTVVPGTGLAAKLEWLQANALSGVDYTVEVTADESIEPHTLSYDDRSNIGITLIGVDSNRIISLSSNGSMFTVGFGVTLVLDNNITLQGRSDNTDSLIYVEGSFTMQGNASVSGNTSSSYGGGGVSVSYNGTFTMNGGVISGNTSSDVGGGVYVAQYGTFTMNGGVISGNTSSSSGGGVYVYYGTFTMSDGEISDNTTVSTSLGYGNGGGGVHVGSGTTFTMSGGEISGNTSSYNGGGVYVRGTFTMSGGEISDNTASSGGGVLVEGGTFTMNGGEISGNTASLGYGNGGGVYVDGTFTMSGGTVYGSNETGCDANNIPLANTANTGAALYVGNGTATYGDGSNILPHTDGHATYTNNTITGGSRNDVALSGSGTEQNPWLVSNAGEWNRTRANIIAATGNYFIRITGNFNVTGDDVPTFGYTPDGSTLTVTISGDRTISLEAGSIGRLLRIDYNQTVIMQDVDLKGHADNTTSLIYVDYGSFTMQGNASVSGNTSSSNNGGGVSVGENGTFTMNGGEISLNTSSYGGGGVSVSYNGTFTMNGGVISGNTSSDGGGVSVVGYGTFTMNGGEISGNTSSYNGGGVYVGGTNATFTMNGGEISGNSSHNGGGVCVFGGTFTMSGGMVYGSNETGHDANDVPLANTAANIGAALFVLSSGTATYGDGSNIFPHTDGHATYTNNTITGGDSRSDNGIALSGSGTEQNPWLVSNAGEWNRARANIIAATGNYFIRITGNFNVTGDDAPIFGNTPDDSTLTVTMSGDRTISLETGSTGSLLRIGNNQTVIMQDVDLKGHADNTTSLIYVEDYGSFTMQGNASVSGNTSSSYGGGVYVSYNGTFTMNGGEISGNTSSSSYFAGGVSVSNGTFTMNGGEISDNTGGGVSVGYGTFTMTDGKISGNTSGNGGGVSVSYGTFTMSGGEISDNTSVSGGGVHVGSNGTFTMTDGKISGNTSSYGGGVLVSGTFTKTNGTIYGYSENDTVNSNVVKDSSDTVLNDRGHAVYVGSSNPANDKRRETTAGPSVNLDSSVDGTAGGWED